MKTITPSELQKTLEKGLPSSVLLLDVRSPAEYRSEHIAGAENIPLDRLEKHVEELRFYKTIYVQCRTGNRSGQACARLKEHHLSNMVNVDGGLSAWKETGFHTITGKKSYSLLQQVQMVAGSLVVLGIALAQWVDPRFVWLSAFVGAGLLFAGLSGTCGMAALLARMPWNK